MCYEISLRFVVLPINFISYILINKAHEDELNMLEKVSFMLQAMLSFQHQYESNFYYYYMRKFSKTVCLLSELDMQFRSTSFAKECYHFSST